MFEFDLEENEIKIHDELGPAWWGLIDAGMVSGALKQMKGKHVTVRLNTPGGSVDEGIAIFNALQQHKGGVTTIVDSLAASMGSYLLQAGEQRIVHENSMVMVHDPWTITFGNSSELRKEADVLDKYAARMIPAYATRSGKSEADVIALMQDESWYTGSEAVEAGFADSVETGAQGAMTVPCISGLEKIAKKIPQSLIDLREANKKERLHEQLVAAGVNRRVLTVEQAKKLVAGVS